MRRRIMSSSQVDANGYEYVDLGLPSGLLWATCNVGAESETDYGLYFAWGETIGYLDASSKPDGFRDYNYEQSDYYNDIDNKIILDPEDDAAHVNMGGSWRMPTADELQELFDNTDPGDGADDNGWTRNYNGAVGVLRKSKTNGNTIFFPANGYSSGNITYYQDYGGYYWTSQVESNGSAYALTFFDGIYVNVSIPNTKYWGEGVRGVISK